MPQHTFELTPVIPTHVEHLKELIDSGRIDFVISQPAIYVELEFSSGISRILTMIDRGKSARFGSVVITRSDSGIEAVEQIRGRVVVAAAPLGFGGWLVGYNELLEQGIDLFAAAQRVDFVGTQPKVLQALMDGTADVGILRTGILEKNIRENRLDADAIRVLNRRNIEGFPYVTSSRLYPEWAFAKTKKVSNSLAKEVAISMMSILPGSDAAQKGGYHEWTTPYSYEPVHELMKKLQAGPYEGYGEVVFWEFVKQHKVLTGIAAVLLCGMVAFMFVSYKMKLKLQEYIDSLDMINIASRTDLEGKILHVSRAFCELTGYTQAELIGKHHNILRHPDTPKKLYKEFWQTIQSGNVWKGEIKNVKKSGEAYWIAATVSPMYNKKNEIIGYAAVREDITDKKKIEKQQNLLLQQGRLAQMGELIGMIAHQWRQPLNIMALSMTKVEMQQIMGQLDSEEFGKVIETVNSQIAYMSQTIDDFKDFFQTDKELQERNLHILVQESIDLLVELFKSRGVDIINEVDYDISVKVFPNELKQVILNVFNNAKDALLEHPVSNKYIRVSSERGDGWLYITITNNGGEIDEDILHKIFEPYFTTKFESKGTGLGLYMSKMIVEEHMHGTVEIINVIDGVCVTIKLPENGK